ncbi:uncharacterized protein FRV6_09420 [Fusarium oxysporum]|uniref:Uncharacterized protein n=1 Tax=Fusarium oxysporum TaxID=5507 RepID=A0A2H3T998_FUSOX|nr:uncharacterized protein FRV6_09420 [Fusarium oxysporum]
MLMMHLDTGKGPAVLDLPGTVLLETGSLDGNEARCVLRSPVHVQRIDAALIGRIEVRGLAGTSNDIRAASCSTSSRSGLKYMRLTRVGLRRYMGECTVADGSNLGVEDHSFKVDGVTGSAPVD